MIYRVKEVFRTLQGEGGLAGRAAVFCRFSLCNLWTGREADRHRALCRFCDTDFVGQDGIGGGRYTGQELVEVITAAWGPQRPRRMVVCTGGEPLLQLDAALVAALHEEGFLVAVETNGTIAPPAGIDWLCVSPKARAPLVAQAGQELKLVYPQDDCDPAAYEHLPFDSFRLQPMDGPDLASNTQRAVQYCLDHPTWQLSLQTHKIVGIP